MSENKEVDTNVLVEVFYNDETNFRVWCNEVTTDDAFLSIYAPRVPNKITGNSNEIVRIPYASIKFWREEDHS